MPPGDPQPPQMPNTPTVPDLVPQPSAPAPMVGGPAPKTGNKWLIISAAILLVALTGGALWYFLLRDKPSTGNEAKQSADTVSVRSVSWVEPANLPGKYIKSDESEGTAKTFYYDDKATDCFIVTDVAPYGTYSDYGKTPKEVVLDLEGTSEEGVTLTSQEAGPGYTFKDVDGREYRFDSLHLTKNVDVENLDHNKEHTVAAYKPFGVYSVSIGITCKDETWEAEKPALEALAKQFTLRTER